MRVSDFDFELPPERIALRPAFPRDASKLLVVRPDGFGDHVFRELPQFLRAGDVLVFNNTRVIPAALSGHRIGRLGTTPKIEALLHLRLDGARWKAFAKPGKKLQAGDRIRFGGDGKVCLLGNLDATVEEKGEAGEITLAFDFHGAVLDEAIAALGEMPLPPYIAGKRGTDVQDRTDYQTVYAEKDGAVAVHASDFEHGDPRLDLILREYARDADVLIMDAQYTPEEYSSKRGWGHSTWLEATNVARDSGVKQLVLFHHDPGHSDAFLDDVVRQARRHFDNTVAAREGWAISL